MIVFTGSDNALFLDNKGKCYLLGQLSDMELQYVKLAGFDRFGACYLYLHNTATTMLDSGADLCYVQEMLSHASILSIQLYIHVSLKKLSEVYEVTHPSAEGGRRLF